jgi:hypothetical protein
MPDGSLYGSFQDYEALDFTCLEIKEGKEGLTKGRLKGVRKGKMSTAQ